MIIGSVLLWGGIAGILGILFFRRPGRGGRRFNLWAWLCAVLLVIGFIILCLGYDYTGN